MRLISPLLALTSQGKARRGETRVRIPRRKENDQSVSQSIRPSDTKTKRYLLLLHCFCFINRLSCCTRASKEFNYTSQNGNKGPFLEELEKKKLLLLLL